MKEAGAAICGTVTAGAQLSSFPRSSLCLSLASCCHAGGQWGLPRAYVLEGEITAVALVLDQDINIDAA